MTNHLPPTTRLLRAVLASVIVLGAMLAGSTLTAAGAVVRVGELDRGTGGGSVGPPSAQSEEPAGGVWIIDPGEPSG